MKPTRCASEACAEKGKVHEQCPRCLEPLYACRCISVDLGEAMNPIVVWTASRSTEKPSVIHRDKKYRYERACREIKRLNFVDRGRVKNFLLPIE